MSVYVPPRSQPAAKAGPVGPGAGPLMTEFLLPNVLVTDPRKKMAQAVAIGREVAYVRAAEGVISTKIADPLLGVAWHLEDPNGDTIDDTYADPRAREAFALVDKPMAALKADTVTVRTREEIWEITSRHMGLAGQGAWYLDGLNTFGIPAGIAYVRPDRLEPDIEGGRLVQWLLDKRPGYAGTRLDPDEVILLQLQTPDEGIWAPGLVESALAKALLNGAIDRHFSQVLAGGGRLSGILSPKTGAIEDDGIYNQMVRDWRNVTEQPESARRLQVVRAPIDFTKTVQSVDEMKLIDLMGRNRDDLLAVWHVPLSQIGGMTPTGLNSGDVRKYDEAALWQNAVTPRLSKFNAALQAILDRFEPYLGWAPQIIFDIPEFDDDSPRFDKLQKAQYIPLTNDERRALINMEPLQDAAVGAAIVMPATMLPYAQLGQQPQAGPSALAQGEAPQKAAKARSDVTPAVLAALRRQWPDEQLAMARQGSWKYDPEYPLAKLNAQRRPVARNMQKVAGIEAAMKIGAPIDPIVAIKTKRLGTPGATPIDGWHRTLAAEHAGMDCIPAYIGSGDDAWTQALLAFNDTIPTPAAKAGLVEGLQALRAGIDARVTPQLRSSVRRVLDAQRSDIVARVRGQYDAIRRKPRDTSIWWKGPNAHGDPWDTALTAALQPHLQVVAQTVQGHVQTTLRPAKALLEPAGALAYILSHGAARISGINETTRSGIMALILKGIEDGLGAAELADIIENWSGFDEYRSELIARTELMDAYNSAALNSYAALGVEQVEAIDGTGDPECAARHGQIFSLAEAAAIEDHPNGTLDWVPLLPEVTQ